MKLLSRDFTTREKVLLLILVLVLIGAGYYHFVHKPVSEGVEQVRAESETLELELTAVEAKLAQLRAMQAEMDSIEESGRLSLMPSYNNAQAELDLMNGILSTANEYTVTLSGVTRSGDQIRRAYNIRFTCDDFAAARRMLKALAGSEYRCLLGDVTGSALRGGEGMDVSARITFYETLVGGTPDSALPADGAA